MKNISRTVYEKRLLIILLFVSICGLISWFYFYSTPVHVTLMEGKILVKPSVINAKRGTHFYVENKGSQARQFIMVIMDMPSDKIPVKNHEAQFFSEPFNETTIIYGGNETGGYSIPGPQENPPAGPPLQPGQKLEVQNGYPGLTLSGEYRDATITILCNLPGHYERGEFAILKERK